MAKTVEELSAEVEKLTRMVGELTNIVNNRTQANNEYLAEMSSHAERVNAAHGDIEVIKDLLAEQVLSLENVASVIDPVSAADVAEARKNKQAPRRPGSKFVTRPTLLSSRIERIEETKKKRALSTNT